MSDPSTGTLANTTLAAFDPELIFANPYQHHSARRFRGDDFDSFVDDIRVNGIHQPPPARPHPDVSGAVQLQMGHRRLAAWRVAHPGEPFTVIVKPISEMEMFEGCAEENFHRADLNEVEQAEMIEEYKKLNPSATNETIIRVFALPFKNIASVTNLRKLARLQPGIKALVAQGQIPQATARGLYAIQSVNAKTAQQIADKVAAAPKSEKQDVFEDTTRNLYWNKLIALRGNWWSMDWLADAPVTVERDLGDGEHLIGACAGCVFNVNDNCARKPCFEEKYKLWAAGEAQRVAEQLKLAVAGENEKTVVLFKGEYNDDDNAKLLLNARKEIRSLLRIAPRGDEPQRHNYLQHVLGSAAVTLVTTDKPALDAYFAELRAKSSARSERSTAQSNSDETDAEKAKRIAAEKKEMDAKRAARSKMWKSYYDALWVLEAAAREIGEELSVRDMNMAFIEWLVDESLTEFHAYHGAEMIEQRIEKEMEQEKVKSVQHALRFALIALRVIAEKSVKNYFRPAENERETNYKDARDAAAETSAAWGVALPDGWDIPPIHHSAFNCWHCGTFAGNTQEKLTKRDIDEDGWIDLGKDGVFCSENHRAQYEAQHAANANADTKRKSKAKPSTKAKPAPKAAKRAKRK